MTNLQVDQNLADRMVQQAISFCADKAFGGNVQQTLQALQQGRCEVCDVFSGNLIEQIGGYLGEIDRTVKAVFRYDPTINPAINEDQPPTNTKAGMNLIAWVDRKSAALSALGGTLEKVMSASQRKIGCRRATPICYTLDVAMVDDRDIDEQRGYGLIVKNHLVSSNPIWKRIELFDQEKSVGVRASEQSTSLEEDFFDPELAPESLIIEKARAIEKLPSLDQASFEHHLTASKVVLIHRIISDQQAYIDIAKNWFTVSDLEEIYKRRIGYGRIGGKTAGMLLAARILNQVADEDLLACLQIPESYFLGSDLIYIFMAMNGLMHWNDQKYKPEEQIYAEYPQIQEDFQAGKFPPEILEELQTILEEIGPKPLIVRSSSQLEDNFGTSFAGKYDSFFCPNQGSPEENLRALINAIARTYASTLKPEALLYRRRKGLQDYDERMAVLIQVVQGEQFGRYYFPHGAGVAFSRNLYRWAPQIRREDGFARMVWGLGTRAVQRVGDDYPRLVALSHPALHPDDSTEAIRRYSQQYVDVIDLEDNDFKTLPIHEVIAPRYPPLRLLSQLEKDGFFVTPRMRVRDADIPNLAFTFDEMLRRTQFAPLLSRILRLLEEHYHGAVDMEFTFNIPNPQALNPEVEITLLQCRPQSYLADSPAVRLPENLLSEDIILSTGYMVPQGYLANIRFVLFVSPEAYFALPTSASRRKIGEMISRLNAILDQKSFICIGPGRWGSTNLDLGVYVSYADIHNAGALVELSGSAIGPSPEPSLGTHFFQDLMEAQIYPLVISFDDKDAIFNNEFFYHAPNSLLDWLEVDPSITNCLRLIDVTTVRPEHHIELVMDSEQGRAVAFLSKNSI